MLTIIGCGNLNRNDDGVGVIIAQRLQQYLAQNPHPKIRVFDCGTAGMEVIFQVPGKELEALPEPSYNLHDLRWDHALAAGRKIFLDDFPEEVTVYLIEAANLDLGLELSPVVQRSADLVFAELITVIEENLMA
jgi:hydrogenase maturation protease